MATYSSSLRSGLPREPGGEPWPPEGTIGEPIEPGTSAVSVESAEPVESVDAAEQVDTDQSVAAESPAEAEQPTAVEADAAGESEEADESGSLGAGAAVGATGVAAGAAVGTVAAASDTDADSGDAAEQPSESTSAQSSAPAAEASIEVPLRRGLPRVAGGDPWPPEGLAPAGVKAPSNSEAASAAPEAEPAAQSDSDSSSVAPAAAGAAGAGAAVAGAAVASDADTEPASQASADAEPADSSAAAGTAPAGDVPLRRGLPRVAGGDPWPPEGLAPAGAKAAAAPSASPAAAAPSTPPAGESAPAADGAAGSSTSAGGEAPAADDASTETDKSSAAPAAAATAGAVGAGAAAASGKKSSGELSDTPLRRGLPRVAGGDPWPPEGFAPASTDSAAAESSSTAPAAESDSSVASAPDEKPSESSSAAPAAAAGAAAVGAGAAGAAVAASSSGDKSAPDEKPAATSADPKSTRSGLSKSTGPAQRKPMGKPAAKATDKPTAKPAAKPADKPAAKTSSAPAKKAPAASSAAKPSPAAASAKASGTAAKKKEPTMIGSKSVGQWAKLGGLGLGGLIVVAGILVLAARGLTTLPGVPEFLEKYPGEYALPEFVDDGFPAWASWTHFLNVFFMVLIIRSGLQVRYQQKPPAFYTPKKGGKKISINLWFHTGIDLFWLANGVVFVVLLFASGHWARIVPTSWEVFPNAVSAMLQYAMLDWPTEHGWVNYNSLQQLMYFLVVFVAAPLAAITGVRMSEWWPKDAAKLNKIYPAPLARAIHFPTMIFFVVFIIIHVFLVFATGMRQNLNHMYGGSDDVSWVGFIWFVASLAVIVGGWFAARPMLLAPIANMFGRVSSR
ncbi:cytochrome b/b6 domain-containing protein [Brevibacterium sandarakinum]|nr:cytochrome b/b6 domain-containing protein [Brevibacterium sandarakinum]